MIRNYNYIDNQGQSPPFKVGKRLAVQEQEIVWLFFGQNTLKFIATIQSSLNYKKRWW